MIAKKNDRLFVRLIFWKEQTIPPIFVHNINSIQNDAYY